MHHHSISSIATRLASLMMGHDRAAALGRLALACVAVSAASCTSDLEPLNVTAYFPLSTADATVCEPDTSTSLVKGLYDVNRRGANQEFPGYVVGLMVKSDLDKSVNQPGAQTLRIGSNTAQLQSLTAKYTWSPADKGTPAVTIGDMTFPISAMVPAGEEKSFPVQILPGTKEVNGALTKGKSGTLTVEITMTGTLQNGSSVTSTPSYFSIGVCTDCITECTSDQKLTTPCSSSAAGQTDGRLCVSKTTTTTTQ